MHLISKEQSISRQEQQTECKSSLLSLRRHFLQERQVESEHIVGVEVVVVGAVVVIGETIVAGLSLSVGEDIL